MAYAITLPLRGAVATATATMQDALAPFADNPAEMAAYGPHVSLAVCDGRPPDGMEAALGRLAGMQSPVVITVSGPAVFVGDVMTVYAVVTPTVDLLACHRAVHDTLALTGGHAVYAPGHWVPHCTLAINVPRDRLGAALAKAADDLQPLSATLDRLELVTFPPVEVVVSRPIAGH